MFILNRDEIQQLPHARIGRCFVHSVLAQGSEALHVFLGSLNQTLKPPVDCGGHPLPSGHNIRLKREGDGPCRIDGTRLQGHCLLDWRPHEDRADYNP